MNRRFPARRTSPGFRGFFGPSRPSSPRTGGRGSYLACLAGLAALVAVVGCRRLETKDGFPCSTAGECPSSYTCATDHKCYRGQQKADGGPDGLPGDVLDGPTGVDVSTNKDGLGPDADPGIVAPPGSVETGQPCAVNADCGSSFCANGVCCATACDGICMACAAPYTGKENGTCAPTNGGMDPDDDCQAAAPETCGDDGWCDGAGACRKFGSNQICAESACTGSMFVATRTCDGAGACAPAQATDCGTSPCALTGCATPCQLDAECGPTAYCGGGTCKVKKTSGTSCDGATECGSGFCADGVCCETACTGACLSCSELHTGQMSGKCQPVQAGKDPDDDCATDVPTTCGRDGTCDGSGGCRKYDSTTACAEASCAGSVFTPARRCLAGACAVAAPVDCGQAQCAVEGCRKGCSVDSDCSATSYCAGGTCAAKKGNGSECQLGNECTSKACVDLRCCETACTGKCYACAMAKSGQADGKCAPILAGTDPEDECVNNDESTCSTDGMCDGTGACRLWSKGSPCAAGMCNTTGNYLSARTCDGLGTCSPSTTDVCVPNLCTATGCKRSCSVDGDCLGNYYCDGTTCAPKKAAGGSCNNMPNQCLSNFCVDNFCCDAKCDGKCVACAGAKTGQTDGKCAPVPPNKDPDGECPKDANNPCGFTGCNGAGSCQYTTSGTMCANASCTSPNTYMPARKCDGAGNCPVTTAQMCSDSLVCGSATACKTTCMSTADCVAGNYCKDGNCLAKKGNGVHCDANDAECTSNFCSGDNYCCNSACKASGGCQSCAGGTCSITSGLTVCPATNMCANTGIDPSNCGICGKACTVMTSNNGVAKCSNGSCVPACAANYMVCDEAAGGYSCVPSLRTFETFTHPPDTCLFGGSISSEHHGGSSSVQLTGSGVPSQSECLMLFPDDCSSGYFDSFGGSNVSVWIKGTLDGQCWVSYDSGQTSMKPVVRGSWTQMSWVIPANATRTAMISIYCDLPDGASWYVDDFLIAQ